jgi:hypothetical protein
MACKRKSPTQGVPINKRQIIERIDSGFATDTATIAILEEVSNIFGIDSLKTTQHWFSRVKAKQYEHVLSKLALPTLSDESLDWNWDICDLGALLNHFINISAFYRDLMAYTFAQHGHVWSLVIYYDELTPGDAFAPDNKRKFWSIYVAFLEFGPHMLAQEEAWLPIGILRTSTAKTIVGGMPNATRLLLGSWCGHPIMLKFNSVLGNSASSSFGNSVLDNSASRPTEAA